MATKREPRGGRDTDTVARKGGSRRGIKQTKCTPQLVETFARAIENGNSLLSAADIVGIARSTLRRWLKKGEDGDETYAPFLARVRLAQARSIEGALRTMMEAAKSGDINAAKWVLERRYRDDPMLSSILLENAASGILGLAGVREERSREAPQIVVTFQSDSSEK